MTTETYTLCRYHDAEPIGECELTAEQFADYLAMSDRDTGAIRLGALPHDFYDLAAEYQDTHEDTTVYIEA